MSRHENRKQRSLNHKNNQVARRQTLKLREKLLRHEIRDKDPPSEKYIERIEAFSVTTVELISLSKECEGIPSRGFRDYYASVLLTAMVTRCVSIGMLLPFSIWADQTIEHWDYASVATLSRTVMETRLAYHYLCFQECDSVESDFRWNLFNLHDAKTREKLAKTVSSPDEGVANLSNAAEEVKGRLRSNSFFQSLPEKRQKALLKGDTPYHIALEELADDVGIDAKTYKFINKSFSNYVHSYPMSFYRMGENNTGRGVFSDSEESALLLSLSLLIKLLVGVREDHKKMFEGRKHEKVTGAQPTTRNQ